MMQDKLKNTVLGPVMLDVLGVTLSDDDILRLEHPLTGGVILFSRNYANREQLCALTEEIHRVRPGILISVDHEGGRVQRFKTDGFTVLPSMRTLGRLWEKDVLHSLKVATALGYILGAELRACGVDLSFTPVLDLDYGNSSVIGDRAFHHDERVVTLLAKSINYGLLLAGMANCGKHFPGHGFVALDSHVAIPVDKRTKREILARDAAPYQWLGDALSAVMPAHVIYPKVDSQPAGFSKKWLSILREEIGFNGVIFSDDLSMEGASVGGSVVESATLALNAGCDMVLICNNPDKADKLLSGLGEKIDMKAKERQHSIERIAKLVPRDVFVSWEELKVQDQYVSALKLVQSL
jgi:beta-N-acetylhexosaminidase